MHPPMLPPMPPRPLPTLPPSRLLRARDPLPRLELLPQPEPERRWDVIALLVYATFTLVMFLLLAGCA